MESTRLKDTCVSETSWGFYGVGIGIAVGSGFGAVRPRIPIHKDLELLEAGKVAVANSHDTKREVSYWFLRAVTNISFLLTVVNATSFTWFTEKVGGVYNWSACGYPVDARGYFLVTSVIVAALSILRRLKLPAPEYKEAKTKTKPHEVNVQGRILKYLDENIFSEDTYEATLNDEDAMKKLQILAGLLKAIK